ncbi:MAG: hypothetical protein FWD46_01500 [Cystobacterineae bacterium]|nr:hypothetical protein [Cystobacterineae bacterium]
MKKAITSVVVFLLLLCSFPGAFAAQKLSNSNSRGTIDGIDTNPYVGEHNSYAWCSELFQQTDGDYLWVGTNRDLAGNILARAANPTPGMYTVFNIPEPSGDMAGRIYRQRASDPDAPWELVHASPMVSGFRRMIVFNEDLYVLAATTNKPIADYSFILRFRKDFKLGDRPEMVFWENLPTDSHEHFRAATLSDDKLYIGTFDSKIYVTDGKNLQDLMPNAGANSVGWSLYVDFADFGIPDSVWDILAFNGSIYAFLAGQEFQDYQGVGDIEVRGFRVVKVTPGPNGLVVEEIVGEAGSPYPFGMGLHKNASASGFLSTLFGQDYVYVTTFSSGPAIAVGFLRGLYKEVLSELFSPAQIYRFDVHDNWEVVVGDRVGENVAVDANGIAVPHIGNQRAGFSLLPDARKNTSFNQYTWWMTEHEGKMYATTWDMSTFKENYAVFTNRYVDTLIDGAAPVLNGHYIDLARLHFLLMRDAHLIDFDLLAKDLDDYLLGVEGVSIETDDELRQVVQGAVATIARRLPTPDFRLAILLLMDIIIDVINETDAPRSAREITADIVEYFSYTSEYFADASDPAGFDLFATEDGTSFAPVVVGGFGDKYNYGGRVMVSSEHGLHVMTANPFNGAQVWRADPISLGIYPNGPRELALSRSTVAPMTVLVTDARATGERLQLSYNSHLVDVQVVRRAVRDFTDFQWDNPSAYDPIKDTGFYTVNETSTQHQSDLYDVIFTPIGVGRQSLTLHFEIGGVRASKTVELSVEQPGTPNKMPLAESLYEASSLNRSDYDTDSWSEFLAAYIDALTVYNTNATQAELDAALSKLTQTMGNLVPAQAPSGYTVVSNETQLRNMSRTGKYWLANDIELTKPWTPIALFDGTLDGNGRSIRGLAANNPKQSDQGLFRRTRNNALIKDLELIVADSGVHGNYRVGALVGWAENTKIMGVRVMIGNNGVTGARYVGGLVGKADNSIIGGSFTYGPNGLMEIYASHPEPNNTFAVRGTALTTTHVGGLAGELQKSVVSSCSSYANATGYMGVGGLVGNVQATGIENSFARGYVLGQTQISGTKVSYGEGIGGLIGIVGGASAIENVYASGIVESAGSRRINPLVGYVSSRLLTRGMSFYDTDVAQKSTTATQDMSNIDLGKLKGESTKNMKTVSTFTRGGSTWDFDTIWDIGWFNGTPAETPTYPYFMLAIALQSAPPIIRGVVTGASTITGVGTSTNALISVALPNGATVETQTDPSLEWSVAVPRSLTLAEGDEIRVTQREVGMPESDASVARVEIERPINISAGIETENLSNKDTGVDLVGDVIKYSITLSNDGNEKDSAEHLQVVDLLPASVTWMPDSVRYISENEEGVEVVVSIPKNKSAVSVRGHSFDAKSRKLEIRLGNFKLSGGRKGVVEFSVRVNAKAKGKGIPPRKTQVTAHKVSKTSKNNHSKADVLVERLRIRR